MINALIKTMKDKLGNVISKLFGTCSMRTTFHFRYGFSHHTLSPDIFIVFYQVLCNIVAMLLSGIEPDNVTPVTNNQLI